MVQNTAKRMKLTHESDPCSGEHALLQLPLQVHLFRGSLCNYHHPGPRRVWEVGSEPRSLPPFRSLPWLPRRVPKTPKLLLYASLQSSRGPRTLSCDAQAAELVRVAALPCRREHHEINFHQKNTLFGRPFFVFLSNGAKHLIFTRNYHLRDD